MSQDIFQKVDYSNVDKLKPFFIVSVDKSDFQLFDKIKSIKSNSFKVTDNSKEFIESSESGYYIEFDSLQKIQKKVLYSDINQIKSETEYYNYKYDVTKQNSFPQRGLTIKIELDSLKNTIIYYSSNNERTELEYFDNYLPTKIINFRANEESSKYGYLFDENKNLTLESRYGVGTTYTKKYVYSENQLKEYCLYKKIDFLNDTNPVLLRMKVQINENSKSIIVTESYFTIKKDKLSIKKVKTYNFEKSSRLLRISEDNGSDLRHEIQYDEYFNVVESKCYDSNNKSLSNLVIKYNEMGDIKSKFLESSIQEQREFIYEYDSKSNWVQRKEFLNKELIQITEREIEYYNS